MALLVKIFHSLEAQGFDPSIKKSPLEEEAAAHSICMPGRLTNDEKKVVIAGIPIKVLHFSKR